MSCLSAFGVVVFKFCQKMTCALRKQDHKLNTMHFKMTVSVIHVLFTPFCLGSFCAFLKIFILKKQSNRVLSKVECIVPVTLLSIAPVARPAIRFKLPLHSRLNTGYISSCVGVFSGLHLTCMRNPRDMIITRQICS